MRGFAERMAMSSFRVSCCAFEQCFACERMLCSSSCADAMPPSTQSVRQELHDHLVRINPDKKWDFIVDQARLLRHSAA